MKRTAARFLFASATLALAILTVAGPGAHAQTPPAAPEAADPAFAAQKAAFLALPEAMRKAAQDALVWLGFYNGVADGDFGKRTRDAILAFQASMKAPADGMLPAAELEALLAAAQKARDAVGFQVVSDAKTEAKIGAPAKLLDARAGTRLDFASSADADLSALYARLTAGTQTRKVAYKAVKPDDLVAAHDDEIAASLRLRRRTSATRSRASSSTSTSTAAALLTMSGPATTNLCPRSLSRSSRCSTTSVTASATTPSATRLSFESGSTRADESSGGTVPSGSNRGEAVMTTGDGQTNGPAPL